MSASQYRSQLKRKRKQRLDAQKKAGEYRSKETRKRSEVAKARSAASKAKSAMTARSKLREAERREKEAEQAGKDADRWQGKATDYAEQEADLQTKLDKAERAELDDAQRRRERETKQAERRRTAADRALHDRLEQTEAKVDWAMRDIRAPKTEKLRILLLGSSSERGERALRVGREQKRIRNAVESALLRDYVELDVRPAATTEDLLDGITKNRPHVVHFSGHSDDDLIEFEDETDDYHEGVVVTARAFASAVRATDDPPLLVLLNSCNSAAQIDRLVQEQIAPFAIGMADEIEDGDAITYAAQFYAAVANGQSIRSAHLSAQAALELAGLAGAELPTLAHADDVDPATAVLVKPAE
ncbi:hypothetical protein AGRA3207_007344 [Actinomadura graeca]|uniref:CHAT domain-containing protein n=1 Tax=Actinomadura graeca TaxID=2750812 RepID=A0ABX8R6B9_9ACTN|nr:CHAT domain-containing protein [Actinomadura graeca]QXJ25794.1 hypothetical protein AGRA3207_007344 [Actinomadura graeca]